MSERAWFAGLSDRVALRVAAAALDRGLAADQLAWRIHDRGSLGLSLALGLPGPEAEALLDQLAGAHPGLNLHAATPGGQSFEFQSGLLALLRPRPGEAGSWTPLEDERLLVVDGLGIDDAGDLLADIALGATRVRIAAADSDNGPVWLYHLVDDRARKSTFAGVLAGLRQSGRLQRARLLSAFRDEGLTLFFPDDARPDRERFDALRDLWRRAGDPLPAAGPALAGFHDGEQRWRCLRLGDLRFVDEGHFTPAPESLPTIVWQPLEDARHRMTELREDLRRRDRTIGHALELQPARAPADTGAAERLRLRQRLAETEQQLAFLESLERSHPLLFRFAHTDIERLGRLLAAFPIDALDSGEIEYAYAADEDGGHHYLWLDADKAHLAAFALPERETEPVRFRLDPHWAGAYYDGDRPALVYVPEGRQLFPTLHAWSPDRMEQHLADCVAAWCRARGDEPPPVPRRALYVFAPDPVGARQLRLHLLDRDGFAPLRTRLGWINDCLAVTRDLGMEAYVQSLAHSQTRTETLLRKEQDAVRAGERFDRMIDQLNQDTLRRVHGTLQVMTDRIQRAVGLVADSRTELERLETSLRKLKKARAGLAKVNRETLSKLDVELADLPTHLRRINAAMETLLARSAVERERMDGRFLAEAEALGRSRAHLVETLKRQLRGDKP